MSAKDNMSANDFILISKSTFKIFHADMDGCYNYEVAQGKDLADAIEKAEEWEKEQMFNCEYGIKFIL